MKELLILNNGEGVLIFNTPQSLNLELLEKHKEVGK